MKNNLIYDTAITGHHPEYISHLVKYLSEIKSDNVYYFVISEEIQVRFPEIICLSEKIPHIKWEFVPKKETEYLYNLPLTKRSFIEFKLVEKYAKQLSAQHVFLLYFNIFQLTLSFKNPKFSISGILFLQFYRMNKKSCKEKIKYYRKYFITKFYTNKKMLKRIFILNDQTTVDYLNSKFKTDKFKMLLDPIAELKPLENFDIKKNYGIEERRKIFLHIGSLDERKGTLDVLDSIAFLEKTEQEKISIIFAGKSSNNFKAILKEKINYYDNTSGVKIIWIDEVISNELMKSLFDQCYCVLLPYKNPEGSSGIYGHATVAGKRIIGNSQGLLGELISNYELGITIDEISDKSIAEGIKKMIINTNIVLNLDRKTRENTPQNFARKLLEKYEI